MIKSEFQRKSVFNKILSAFTLLSNIFCFVPMTVDILIKGGGPFGFGLLLLPFSLLANVLMIPAVMLFFGKHKNSDMVRIANVFGFIIILCLFGFFYRN